MTNYADYVKLETLSAVWLTVNLKGALLPRLSNSPTMRL